MTSATAVESGNRKLSLGPSDWNRKICCWFWLANSCGSLCMVLEAAKLSYEIILLPVRKYCPRIPQLEEACSLDLPSIRASPALILVLNGLLKGKGHSFSCKELEVVRSARKINVFDSNFISNIVQDFLWSL
ncbi:hypothetical protein PTKIN_Ptkin14bG0161800 [Pterospermum kingtungense]